MELEGKQTKKSIPRQIIFKREGSGAKGNWAIFEITFDNNDKGDYFAKSNPQIDFKEGVEIEYTIEKKINGQFTNIIIGLPWKGNKGGGKTFNPIHANKQCALTNAVNIFIAGKIEKDAIIKTAEWLFTYLQSDK